MTEWPDVINGMFQLQNSVASVGQSVRLKLHILPLESTELGHVLVFMQILILVSGTPGSVRRLPHCRPTEQKRPQRVLHQGADACIYPAALRDWLVFGHGGDRCLPDQSEER
jgi:hypothetical protein